MAANVLELKHMPTFKCVVLGDAGTGKTAFIERLLTGQFSKEYSPTENFKVHRLAFQTTRGAICFDVWDMAGQEELRGLGDGHYLDSKCAIIMFDLNTAATYANVPHWYRDLKQTCGEIPIVLCGSKMDTRKREMDVEFHLKKKLPYFNISSKAKCNILKPFLWLARNLFSDPDLKFTGGEGYDDL